MRWAIIFLSLALVACDSLRKTAPPSPEQPTSPPAAPPPAELLAQAATREQSGDFGGAITLLSNATRQYPDAEELAQALSRVRDTWEPRRQTLEDRLLIIRADSLSKKIPLQEQLLEGDSTDRLIKSQIVYSQSQLGQAAQLLTRCGERQLTRSERLARRCLSLSLRIRDDAKTRKLLNGLNSKQENQRARQSRRQQLRRTEAQEVLATSHLQRALELVKVAEDQATIGEIEAIVSISMTELAAASDSSAERKKVLSQITDRLLVVGDNLYRTGEIESAIACWQAVLALDPTREQVGQKMVRAQRVMENLNTLRNQHGGNGPEAPSLSEEASDQVDR